MGQFDEEIPKRTLKEQLELHLKTHEDNLRDLESTINRMPFSERGFLPTYMSTLKSDNKIFKHLIDKL